MQAMFDADSVLSRMLKSSPCRTGCTVADHLQNVMKRIKQSLRGFRQAFVSFYSGEFVVSSEFLQHKLDRMSLVLADYKKETDSGCLENWLKLDVKV